MLRGTGATSSVIHAAGAPGGGVSARPNALVVLVKTNRLSLRRHRLLQQVQRAGDVRVDELLPLVRGDMGLVQRRGVQHRVAAGDRLLDQRAVRDRADDVGVRRGEDVEADHVGGVGAQHAHERLAEMARAAGDENPHALQS